MKIDIINNALPPRFDAIGHYTAIIARELAERGHTVRILTATTGTEPDALPGVEILPCFTTDPPSGVEGLAQPIVERQADWIVLQYNPFGYGRRGFNLHLPRLLSRLRRQNPALRLALMAHETFVPNHGSLAFVVMSLWQRPQFRQLGRAADVIFFSIDPWIDELKHWFPGKPLIHLPVPSNMPHVPIEQQEARQRLGIDQDAPVIGLFGAVHISRMLPLVQQTVEAARSWNNKVRVVYIGPDRATIEPIVGDAGIFTDGPADGEEVSRRFAAMDVTLSTFVDGVSTRRGSSMTSLQHGIAVAGTLGHHTDTILRENADKGPLLADVHKPDTYIENVLRLLKDPTLRDNVARNGKLLYDRYFAPAPVVDKLLAHLTTPTIK